MKNVLTLLLFTIVGYMFGQTIQINPTMIDYGTIKSGSNGTKVFVVTNTGNKPLIISNVKTGCNCTVPNYPKTPLLPGKSANIEVKYDTKIKGSFSKSIEIFSNDPANLRKVVKIKGIIQ